MNKSFIVLMIFFLPLLITSGASGAQFSLWPDVQVELSGDFIGGYFSDKALKASSGRETQIFKMSRGLLGFEAIHESGFGGLFEYNFTADEPKRVDGNAAYVDYYKNLGTELLYYGDFKARNAYAFWRYEGSWLDSRIRLGRMVNIIGFEEDEVHFWGRNDSPHAHYLTKEILNGIAVSTATSWLRLETAILSGRGRPDSDYNWYLQGQTDPNTKGNNTPVFEAEVALNWREYIEISGGYHQSKTGSAPGGLFSGKHNDTRQLVGARLQTGYLGFWLNRIVLLGQFSRFEDGLTEDGSQGNATPELCQDLRKDGWFVGGGLHLFDRLALYATYEEIDRVDAMVWKEIAKFDFNHPAMDSIERSTIVQVELKLNPWATVIGFYRMMEFGYPELSQIRAEDKTDKAGVQVRVQF
ncbi:MAG: hypothetical protein WCY68_04235 [Desulfuromonadales bacterium]